MSAAVRVCEHVKSGVCAKCSNALSPQPAQHTNHVTDFGAKLLCRLAVANHPALRALLYQRTRKLRSANR